MALIKFNRNNFNKCICGGCPVQISSPCIIKEEKLLAPQKEQIEKQEKMPDPKTMPGVYCSQPIGKSPCNDLKTDKTCLCPACPVTFDTNLHNNYYCDKGSAYKVG